MSEPLTAKLNNGLTVTAKLYYGKNYPMTYANRTQAENAIAKMDNPADWYIYHGTARPFFVARRKQDPKP